MDIICAEQIFELAELIFEGCKVQTKNPFWGWSGEGGGDGVWNNLCRTTFTMILVYHRLSLQNICLLWMCGSKDG